MRTGTISISRAALLGYIPVPVSAMPCFSMPTCLRPTGRNTMGSHLVISQGAQYSHLLPKITMPRNHQAPLIDLHSGEPFPLVLVGDFQLEDNIFPGMPGDSLLYNSDDLTKLHRLRFQVATHRMEQTSAIEHKEEKSQSSCGSGEMPSSTSKNRQPSKSRGKSPWAPSPKTTTDSPNRKSLHCNKHSPPSKECHGSHNKDSHGSKHQDKSCSESSKSLWKCAASPPQKLSCTTWVEKEPHLEGPPLVFHASSQSHQLSESDNQFSFTGPTSALTPNRTESGLCGRSVSSDSRHFMTPFKMGLSRNFNIPGDAGIHCVSLTPVTSVARSQQVTSSRWHHPAPFSSLPLQGLDPLSAEQAAEIYHLSTECQALGSDLAKRFQTICRLKASHHAMAQATTHEMVHLDA